MNAKILVLALGAASIGFASQFAVAGNSNARNVVDSIRQADPPQVSTGTKQSPLGQSTTDYHPRGPSIHPKEPPSPVLTDRNRNNNPQNDKAVQDGFNRHQKQHGR